MTEPTEKIVIKLDTVANVTDLLQRALSGTENFDSAELDISANLIKIFIKVDGEEFNHSEAGFPKITTGFARGLGILQDHINQIVLDALKEEGLKSRMSDTFKRDLEIVFELKPGCAEGNGDAASIFDYLKSIGSKMTPRQSLIATCVVILSIAGYFGATVARDWHKDDLQHEEAMASANTAEEAVKALAEIAKTNAVAKSAQEHMKSAQTDLVRSVPGASMVITGTRKFDADEIKEIQSRKPRSRTKTEVDVLEYHITGSSEKNPGAAYYELKDKDGTVFKARVEDDPDSDSYGLSMNQRKALALAQVYKRPISLPVEIITRDDGSFYKAFIQLDWIPEKADLLDAADITVAATRP